MSTGTPSPFRLPPDVTVTRQTVADGVAYVFRHQQLGLLGQLIATEHPDQQTLLTAEVAGDPADRMTAARRALLEPLVEQLEARLLQQLGRDLPPRPRRPPTPVQPSGPRHRIPAQLLQCQRCHAAVGHLIFVEDPSLTLEDHARLMYQRIQELQLPTWIIGPPPRPGEPPDQDAEILKVYPVREPPRRLSPAAFHALIDPLTEQHCDGWLGQVRPGRKARRPERR
jgi:hypothetical protein